MFNKFFSKIKDYTRQISEIESSVDKEKQNFLEVYERNLILEKEISERTQELGQANKSILALNNILSTINSSSPLEEVLKHITNGVCNDLGYIYSIMFRLQEGIKGEVLKVRAISDNPLTEQINSILEQSLDLLEIPINEVKNPITKYLEYQKIEKIRKFDNIFDNSSIKLDDRQILEIDDLFKKYSIFTLPIKKEQ